MRKKSKGQLLILVLGVMGIGLITIGPLLAYVDVSLRLSTRSAVRNSAYYAAEAGVQLAIGDLYQAEDPIFKSPYMGAMNDYDFTTTVTNGSGVQLPEGSSVYVDPGITMYMRPMLRQGCSCRANMCANYEECYSFVASRGKAVKINWAGYTSDASRMPLLPSTSGQLNTIIHLYDSDGNEIATGTPTPEERYASDKSRIVANTMLVPGEDISGGIYYLRFENLATYGAAYANATSQFFSDEADAEWFTFDGSITKNCSSFFDRSGAGWGRGNVTVMAINEDNGDRTSGGWGGRPDTNTFSFFCDYVSLSVTSNVSGNITTNTYTYNATNASSTGYNRSYWGMTTVGSGSGLGSPGNKTYHSTAWYGGNYHNNDNKDYYAVNVTQRMNASVIRELDAGNYSKISAPDGDRMLATYDPRLVGMNNSCLWHVFNIPEGFSDATLNQVTRIDVHWEGYQTKAAARTTWWGTLDNRDNDELYLLLWNYGNTTPCYHILDCKETDGGYTWVKIEQGGFSDYVITSTASRDGEDAVTVSCYIRQTPGPSVWWEEQSLEILSWNVHIW